MLGEKSSNCNTLVIVKSTNRLLGPCVQFLCTLLKLFTEFICYLIVHLRGRQMEHRLASLCINVKKLYFAHCFFLCRFCHIVAIVCVARFLLTSHLPAH